MIKFIKSSQGFGLIGILIVIAVIALAGGGGFYWSETKKQQSLLQTGADAIKRAEELKKQIESHQEQIYGSPTSIDLDGDTSGWKTYRNEKYEFEVRYPSEWNKRENLIGDFGLLFQASIYGQKFYEFTVIVVSRDREDYLNLSKRFSKVQERSIDNVVCEVSPEMFNYDQTTYFILCRKNNFIYSLEFPNGEKNKENSNIADSIVNAKIAEKILSTFKFIK